MSARDACSVCGKTPEREQSPGMAAPAPRRDRSRAASAPLPAVERNLRTERAKRRARIEHARERKAARRRFLFLLVLLLVAVGFLALTILDQIRSLFGI
jgi:hypothetical protein